MSDHYQALERDLLGVLADVGSTLTPAESKEVQLYLDAGEYNLALETICAVLKRNQTSISASTYVSLEDLGTRMDAEPDVWKGLKLI